MSKLWQPEPGSADYYCLRFSKADQQAQIAVVLAWRAKLTRMIFDSPDPGASRLKLDWWRAQLENDQTVDPMVMNIQPFVKTDDKKAAFRQWLHHTEQQLSGQRPETTDAYFSILDNWGLAFAALLNSAQQTDSSGLSLLGSYIARLEHLNHLHLMILKQKNIIPEQLLIETGLTDLFHDECKQPENLKLLSNAVLQTPRENVKQWLNANTPYNADIKPLVRLTRQAAALDKKMQKSQRLHSEKTTLSPLKNLWTTWYI